MNTTANNTKLVEAQKRLDVALEAATKSDAVQKAREALDRAVQEEHARVRAEKLEAERRQKRALHAKLVAPVYAIVAALKKAGHKAASMQVVGDTDEVRIDSGVEDVRIVVEEQRTSHGWRSYGTGKFVVLVSSTKLYHTRSRRFPQLKSGEFNTAKVVAAVEEMHTAWLDQVAAKREKESREMSAAVLVKRLRDEYGLGEYGPVQAKVGYRAYGMRGRSEWREYYVAAKGRVLVKFGTLELTPENARVVLDALKKVGALKS